MRLTKSLAFIILLTLNAGSATAENEASPAFASAVVGQTEAKTEEFDWGTLISYYSKDTYGTKDALAAVAIIKPGMEIHPPHEHAEEEYLMILEGSGEWHLQGQDFPASKGDMLYAHPWDIHGIRNTGNTPLTFVVWKWNNKGLAAPER